jgi:hypothetical protein
MPSNERIAHFRPHLSAEFWRDGIFMPAIVWLLNAALDQFST